MRPIIIKSPVFGYGLLLFSIFILIMCSNTAPEIRQRELFTKGWKFHLGDVSNGNETSLNDSGWRTLNLPHDWSIEGKFSQDNPAGISGGALPGGIGWYRKTFILPQSQKYKLVFIDFDGVYRNSEVWINGHYLGKRPYGYSSFRYELTPYLKFGQEQNVIAVKVDNSQQPNSRWYSGSGIYRNVWLVITDSIYVDHWGTYVTTPLADRDRAGVTIKTRVRNKSGEDQSINLTTIILDDSGEEITRETTPVKVLKDSVIQLEQSLTVVAPNLWSAEKPCLYKAVTLVEGGSKVYDNYETTFGIRTFEFDPEKGFFLNGKSLKIKGVCYHHDLGCLGAAINTRAIERQLELLKNMGCNAIRTSHNPPAPELLDLCDKMGFIVMDEAFDMWLKEKNPYDYHLDFEKWHTRDLQDMVLRDRNHPSVFVWSIGNEVMEQYDKADSSGAVIARELAAIVKNLDTTRPITAACNDIDPQNPVMQSGALDLIGYNYRQDNFAEFPKIHPGKKFIATETESSLATRGHYDMPSDSIRRWPKRWDLPFVEGNPDNTCSAYDNCSAPWGSTHEETWKVVKKYDFISGQFTWTGFDYLGEPTPYQWPSRSSYFGMIDLAGFPKDAYYFYQSEWTDKPMLHLFPHWNWKYGQTIDVWAYSNCEEVELFLNDKSLGTMKKTADTLHVQWHVKFEPGVLKAVGRIAGKDVLTKEVKTAGAPARISLEPDRNILKADRLDLSFVTVRVLDNDGIMVPHADNLIYFKVNGPGNIIGVDNGSQTSLEPFQADNRSAFNGMCLAVIRATGTPGKINLEATSDGLQGSSIAIQAK